MNTSKDGGSCALLMDMGTGKSITTVAIAGRLFADGKIKRMLVVAPSSVCAVWPNELRSFAGYPYRVGVLLGDRERRLRTLNYLTAPTMPGTADALKVAVINYESTWRLEDELIAFGADIVVCDESQRIKSHTARQSKAMHRIGDHARYKLILTGTPVQNDTRDFWSQYRFLDPSIFNCNYYSYEKRYAIFGGFENRQYLGPRNVEELTAKAHSIAFRVTKAECLDLPEKTFETREVTLEPSAAQLYKRLQKESVAALEDGGEVTANNVLVRLLRLQQVTGGFLMDDDGQLKPVSTAKMDALTDVIQSAVDEGHKIVVFARFRAELGEIVKRAQSVLDGAKKGYKQVLIQGDVPIASRGAIVEQFQKDEKTLVFVGQLEACAEGITLTAADTMVYYSLSFNLGKFLQSQDRIHRIGQRNVCTYIHLVVPGTIDHKILSALSKKQDLARSLTDNWRELLT